VARQTIAIDVDDVLANSSEALRLVVNERLNVNLSPEDYRLEGEYWTYYKTVWERNGLADRISLSDLEPMMIENQAHVAPHDDAPRVLTHLAKKYKLVVVTSRSPSWRPATEAWLNAHFPHIFGEILFTRKSEGSEHLSKGQLCRRAGAAWLIDDNVEHARSALDQGLKVVLFGDYGWNQKTPQRAHRCKNWQEVSEYFDGRS
jgi:5'(3')-deoxyribonucleotidase